MYPSTKFRHIYDSNTPQIFAIVVSVAFILVVGIFFLYDWLVQKRNHKMIATTARSNTIVSSFLPRNIRDRLIGAEAGAADTKKGAETLTNFMRKKSNQTGSKDELVQSKPMADLFLETTVLFADIVGFTAWSSAREPFQVFTLLEHVYASFDQVAKRRGVFKIETVGDCYVAATGIPNPRSDHAVVMCRFATDILNCMHSMRKKLEVALGPDTSDLSLRYVHATWDGLSST